MTNEIKLEFDSLSVNESFARMAASAFLSFLNPTLEEMSDVKTAVSEAVTNSIIHGYGNGMGKILMQCRIEGQDFYVSVTDFGCGIKDIKKAMEPLYTTRPDLERSGMGFAFMEAFMDDIQVESQPEKGTKVSMRKRISLEPMEEQETVETRPDGNGAEQIQGNM